MDKNNTPLGETANALVDFLILVLENKRNNIKTNIPKLAVEHSNQLLNKLEIISQVKYE
jgi:hypothetical protein